MSVLPLGRIIDPTDFDLFIEASEELEIVVHKYGKKMNIPNYPCWMEYKNEGNLEGSISFTRHTDSHPVLKDMVTLVLEKFSEIFKPELTLKRDRVHFIKTLGNIVPHRDEDGRMCCINMGVKNSSGSLTKVGMDNRYDTFQVRHDTYVMKEGEAYLVNTHQIHSVVASNDIPRYLITYGFGEPFNKIATLLNPKT
jgi:hypothetical protein